MLVVFTGCVPPPPSSIIPTNSIPRPLCVCISQSSLVSLKVLNVSKL